MYAFIAAPGPQPGATANVSVSQENLENNASRTFAFAIANPCNSLKSLFGTGDENIISVDVIVKQQESPNAMTGQRVMQSTATTFVGGTIIFLPCLSVPHSIFQYFLTHIEDCILYSKSWKKEQPINCE